jgi:hypothetical protein
MHSRKRWFLILIAALASCWALPNLANADEEGRLPLAHMQFDSLGLDNSGPINVQAAQDSTGITELKVSAFGKLHTVTKAQLAPISGYVFNAIGVSYSRGYPNTGGRSVYVLLCQGFSSGAEVVAVVTIAKRGDVRVRAVKPNLP